jgi:hypothetical protein
MADAFESLYEHALAVSADLTRRLAEVVARMKADLAAARR